MITTINEWRIFNESQERVTILMRGIPGSGKSTRAKQLVGNGVIHSTDDLIEAQGDYNDFFAKMIEAKDFTPLIELHGKNLANAIESMKSEISPVIIDNTNLKMVDVKPYVVAAQELGYVIVIEDIGTGGLTAEELAARNTHAVPLNVIENMIKTHQAESPFTVERILNA